MKKQSVCRHCSKPITWSSSPGFAGKGAVTWIPLDAGSSIDHRPACAAARKKIRDKAELLEEITQSNSRRLTDVVVPSAKRHRPKSHISEMIEEMVKELREKRTSNLFNDHNHT